MIAPSRRQLVQGVGVVGLGLVAGCGRLQGPGAWLKDAQPPARVPRVGYLTEVGFGGFDLFQRAMRDLGYVEGQNVVFEYRDPEGNSERLAEYAVELARLPVDVIVAGALNETRAAMRATSTIPIVMGFIADPVGQGLVASLSRPGGNVTGTSALMAQLNSKRLELLKEAIPSLTRVVVLRVRGQDALTVRYDEIRGAADALGVQLLPQEVDGPDEFPDGFARALQEGGDGVLVAPHPLFAQYAQRLSQAAALSGLPTMYPASVNVAAGGLMAYGTNPGALRKRSAYYVDRILKGARPSDLPVEQPTTFDFIINLKTAQALGLTIPEHVLLQATEVIQ